MRAVNLNRQSSDSLNLLLLLLDLEVEEVEFSDSDSQMTHQMMTKIIRMRSARQKATLRDMVKKLTKKRTIMIINLLAAIEAFILGSFLSLFMTNQLSSPIRLTMKV